MSFLTPLFLVGLGALAVPIFIHLIHREKKNVVAFPSLMFLRKIPYKSVRKQKLRHLLLFALRCLALILVVAAFARPFLARHDVRPGLARVGARELVILVDRSYSMGYGSHWSKALDAARSVVNGVAADDRATVVFFADAAAAANKPTSDRGTLRAAIDGATLGSGITRYEPALKLAQKILEESDRPRREVVLISDFQRVGWNGREELRLPEGTVFNSADVSEKTTSNIAVTSVDFARDNDEGRERVIATARLTHQGGSPTPRFDASIEVNGRTMSTRPVRLEPNSSTTVTFDPFALPEGTSRGIVRAGTDALPQDNSFNFVLDRGQALSVLVAEEPDAPAGRSIYLRRALGIGDQPTFKVDVKKVTQLAPADLSNRSLVILNDAPYPGGETGRRLQDFVARGGGLFVVLGEHSPARGWPSDAANLLPASFGSVVERTEDRPGSLSSVDRSHPIFDLFSAPRSGDFAAARFFRYRALEPAADATVLARFDDGAPALVEKKTGQGKTLVWASSLDGAWNDLPLQPVFLPFIQQLAKNAAGYTEERGWSTVGQVLDVSRRIAAMGEDAPTAIAAGASASNGVEFLAVSPSGVRTRLPASNGPHFLELGEQGFYEIRQLGGRAGQPRPIAVNLDPAESDLTTIDPREIKAAVAWRGPSTHVATAAALTPEEQERRQTLWWYLLVGAMLALAAETMLSNRLSRTAR